MSAKNKKEEKKMVRKKKEPLKLIPEEKDYKLVYVKREDRFIKVYFINLSETDAYGDDWDDAPYEHNAGEPYYDDDEGVKIKCFIIDDAYYYIHPPCDGYLNSPYSVEDINYRKEAPWLTFKKWDDKRKDFFSAGFLYAGEPMSKFLELWKELGFVLYAEVKSEKP